MSALYAELDDDSLSSLSSIESDGEGNELSSFDIQEEENACCTLPASLRTTAAKRVGICFIGVVVVIVILAAILVGVLYLQPFRHSVPTPGPPVPVPGSNITLPCCPVFGGANIMNPKAYGTCPHEVQQTLRFGCDRTLANRIACKTRNGAEPSGYWLGTSLLKDVDQSKPYTFYDSVTGKPLFKLGSRPFAEWKAESTSHGWPSFRDAEVVWENVRVLQDGETVSVDGTHLGHNTPDGKNRYCIDLVSIVGNPA